MVLGARRAPGKLTNWKNREKVGRKFGDKVGYKDCTWERNELVALIDTVYSSNNPNGSGAKVFQLKIDFNFTAYALKYVPDY